MVGKGKLTCQFKVYGEESEIVSTELRLQLPTANTEPGGGGGGGGTGGGADNTPNKV